MFVVIWCLLVYRYGSIFVVFFVNCGIWWVSWRVVLVRFVVWVEFDDVSW